MSDKDHENLLAQMKATAEHVRMYAAQIESGEYGRTWEVTDEAGEVMSVACMYRAIRQRLKLSPLRKNASAERL